MEFAFDEFWKIANSVGGKFDKNKSVTHYLAALVAELSYYQVQEYEFGDSRAQLIPYRPFQQFINDGTQVDLVGILAERDFPSFTVSTPNTVAIAIKLRDVYFIGIRGTINWQDWEINFDSSIVPINLILPDKNFRHHDNRMTLVHQGFMSEAMRITNLLKIELQNREKDNDINVIMCGHSLGGAVSALAMDRQMHNHIYKINLCGKYIFGSPRYASIELFDGYFERPLHFWNVGDMVPTVPPKSIGYVEHIDEILLGDWRKRLPDRESNILSSASEWYSFLTTKFEPHSMNLYRSLLGKAVSAQGSELPLINRARKK